MNPTTRTIQLTPDHARRLLDGMENNRPVSPGTVLRYAEMMKNGHWALTGESIIIGSDGILLDGQHRCYAVIKAGVTIPILLVTGVDPLVFSKLGRGKMRRLSDSLALAGYVNTHILAAAVKWLVRERDGFLTNPWMEPHDGMDVVTKHPGIVTSTKWAGGLHPVVSKLLSPSILAYAHYRAGLIDLTKRDTFFERFIDGLNLTEGHPVLVLRSRMVANATSNAKLTDVDKLALCIKSINHFMVGAPLRHLRWSRNSTRPEAFPTWLDMDAREKVGSTNANGHRMTVVAQQARKTKAG